MITDTNRIDFLLGTAAYENRAQIDEMMVSYAAHEPTAEPAPDSGPHPPLRFCTRCQMPVDPKRVMRGSSFCSNECRRADLKDRRDYRAGKACRLCGRPPKQTKPKVVTLPLCDGSTQPELPKGETS